MCLCIIGMKIFLRQIYCLFLFVMMKYKYYRNEKFSKTNLLLVSFGFKNFLGSNFSKTNSLLVPFGFVSKKIEISVLILCVCVCVCV